MVTTYSWKINNMKTKNDGDLLNAVINVYWVKTGVNEDGIEGFCPGESNFNIADILPEKFIKFEDLTEEIVIDWIQSTIDPDYHKGINDRIQKMIDDKVSPTLNPSLPWDPTPII